MTMPLSKSSRISHLQAEEELEIIAGGNVLVWGRLRGTVHAGALGDRKAVICALELAPTQLRIADLIARAPEGGAGRFPEVAFVEHDQIGVEPWETYRK